MRKIEKDKKTLYFMIDLYCQKKHKSTVEACDECADIYQYASKKLDLCKFGDDKPNCKKCTIHCYNKATRSRIREIMRFSGPRIIFHRPYQYIRYALKSGKQ